MTSALVNRTSSAGLDTPPLVTYYSPQLATVKDKFDKAVLRYDAWFLVFVAVLLALGATLLAGMAAWCVVKQHGKFTGHWKWVKMGISVSMECA